MPYTTESVNDIPVIDQKIALIVIDYEDRWTIKDQ